jgi:antitoxin HicB
MNQEIRTMKLTVNVHIEEGSFWASVPQLPGCFASGETLDELLESLGEGIELYLAERKADGEPLVTEARRLMDDPAYVSEARELAALFAELRKTGA